MEDRYDHREAQNGDDVPPPDPLTADVETFSQVIGTAIDELKDMAFGGNIERRHHLESAIGCFEDIGILIKAERIVRDLLLDEVEGPPDADLTTD